MEGPFLLYWLKCFNSDLRRQGGLGVPTGSAVILGEFFLNAGKITEFIIAPASPHFSTTASGLLIKSFLRVSKGFFRFGPEQVSLRLS
jgi:hypothetical protein